MRLLAISDVHVAASANAELIRNVPASPEDWLVLAGDVGESPKDLRFVLSELGPRFAQLLWVPGNHELWTVEKEGLRGQARYEAFVDVCREHGVLTPEDPFARWPGAGPETVIAPLFLLYDYSFRPADVPRERAVAWAREEDLLCTDELLLRADPFPNVPAWCEARVRSTEAGLAAIPAHVRTVLVNHFPLRRSHAVLPRVPRFSIWCGTTQTEDWHVRFRARAVVFGHLHIRQLRREDGVDFHEVSLGYARQWDRERAPGGYLRTVLPEQTGPDHPFRSLR